MQFEGKTIDQITQLSILDARDFFEGIALPEAQAKAAERLLYEIRSRLQVLCDVGVEYLTLDRLSNTLSGRKPTYHPLYSAREQPLRSYVRTRRA